MIGRRALASTLQGGKGTAVKKKRWQLELADNSAKDGEEDPESGVAEGGQTSEKPDESSSADSEGKRPQSRSRGTSRSASSSTKGKAKRSRGRSRRRGGIERRMRRGRQSRSRSRFRRFSRSSSGRRSEKTSDRTLEINFAEITSFSDFVRHSEGLVRIVHNANASDLAMLCRNMARVKYFDGGLMKEVWRALRRSLPSGLHDPPETTEIIHSLKGLNAYDRGVFHAAAVSMRPYIPAMSREQRQLWLDAYQDLKHTGDEEFIQALTTKAPPLELLFDTGYGGKATKTRQVLCMLHGKQRSIDMMVDEGGGHYTCAPNRRCK